MEILSVSLKNFKSHQDRHFVFQPGTNAICGENGAGKTSILEAIAWTLFNHRGAYKNEDLIRNGSHTAQVQVTFVSSLDQRTYQISRCSRSGYTLFDPQLNQKLEYSLIEEEVMPWLREHLGVPPGTDLGRLFANTIGVPQGTFTTDFLQTAEKRKPIFDAILKVEEYRQANQQMLSLEKYAKAEVEKLERAIVQYDDTLKDWDTLTLKRFDLSQEIQQTEAALQQCQQQLAILQVERDRLSTQATQIQQLTTDIDKKTAQIHAQKDTVQHLQTELQQAERAVALCTEHRESYRAYLQAEESLKTLEQARQTQQQLQEQRQTQREQLGDRQTQMATIKTQLERLTLAQVEIQRLAPLIEQQQALEQQQQTVNQQLQTCQGWQQTIVREEKRFAQLQAKQQQLIAEVERLQSLATIVQQIPHLEEQQQRYQQQLSRIVAAAQFEADLRQIVTHAQAQGELHTQQIQAAASTLRDLQQAVPLWADSVEQVLVTLQNGSALQGQLMQNLQAILVDLVEQVSGDKLQQQLRQVEAQLKTMRQQQAQYLTLDAKVLEQATLAIELTEIQQTIESLKMQLATEPDLKQQHAALITQLTELNDPRGRSRLLQQDLQTRPQLEKEQHQIQQAMQHLEDALSQLATQLANFADLSDQFQVQQQQREQLCPVYQLYLEHQQLANSYRQRQSQYQAAMTQLETWQQEISSLKHHQDRLTISFDLEAFQSLQTAHQAAETQRITLTAQLPEKSKLLADYDLQMTRLKTIQDKRAQAETQLKQHTKVERFIKFARKAYKEAGPRITERYVQNISREADRLFRELLNRSNVALAWTRDYEIVVQEGAHSRRFINLSGGEQMCAALAVRLALLKVLADIDIAFFDEPTTNMDRPRREHLAEAIANIKSFRQLFVISHDDTFEKVTENVIFVERED
ncbi:MAG: SMC family ATPase [Scytolyngbya sp. HA4215-MV1]|jgi:exonuclease SbcC|nr:SMC family ATPase [Scytolyngbya sp. HA4215-MV1]